MQLRVPVGDLFFAVHTLDVAGDEVHRARAEERHHGNHVFQRARLHLHQPAAHARAFHLEHAGGFASPQQLVSGRVVGGDVVKGKLNALALADQVAGTRHDGQGGQAQKVHLEDAHGFENTHLELGDGFDRAVFSGGGAGGAVQGQVFDDRLIGDHHARGVRAGIAHHAFHAGGGIDQLGQVWLRFVNLLEFLDLFDRLANGDRLAGDVGDELGDPVHF